MSSEPKGHGTGACSTLTNTPPSPKIDLEQLKAYGKVAEQQFLDTFKGVRVVVDINLKGNSYYCAVSQETYNALKAI